jgi:hypothetical protein
MTSLVLECLTKAAHATAKKVERFDPTTAAMVRAHAAELKAMRDKLEPKGA